VRKKILSLVAIIIFLLFVSKVNAQNITLSLDKNIYYPNETVTYLVSIKNEELTKVNFRIISYFISDDPSVEQIASSSLVEINPKQTENINFSFPVYDDTPSGKYEARIAIYKNLQLVSNTSKVFEIANTKKIIDINLKVCEDENCNRIKKIFLKNQNVYLDYNSKISEISVYTELTMPDKSTKEISLPTSIKADQIGTYSLKVTATKEGYKTTEKTTQFGVIEKEAQIKTYEGVKPSQRNVEIIVVLVIIAIIVLGFLYFKRKKTK
jgi:hypothetical protein